MRRLFCLVAVSLLAMVSCRDKAPEPPVVTVDFLGSAKEVSNIEEVSEVSDMLRDSIINPHDILSFGDYIVLADSRTWKALTIYNQESKSYERFISRGNANNEIKFAADMGLLSAENGTFYLRDHVRSRIFVVGMDKKSGRAELRYMTTLIRLGATSDFEFDGQFIIGAPRDSEHQFFVASSPRKIESRFGDYSEFDFVRDTLPNLVTMPGRMALDREGNRIAYLSERGETIIVASYDHTVKPKVKVKKPIKKGGKLVPVEAVEPVDTLARDSVVMSKIYNKPKFSSRVHKEKRYFSMLTAGLRYGFVSVAASPDYIFALYDGRTYTQAKRDDNEDDLIMNLCVLDWEGNLMMHVKSELGFKAISYNDAQRKLYCLCMTDTGEYEVRTIDPEALLAE